MTGADVPEDLRIGITTTVPAEIIYAAGLVPVDLNNRFITARDPSKLIEEAEQAGFPRNICAWIKGLYSAAGREGIRRLVAVARGDCSNTHALAEILEIEGVDIIDFSFPYGRGEAELDAELGKLCAALGASRQAAEREKERLDRCRAPVHEIDRLTWEERRVTGEENHLWQINCSDLRGDPEAFAAEAESFLEAAVARRPMPPGVRLGLIGIPPICSDLYRTLESLGGRVVFNEMQRQFSMPYRTGSLAEQYRRYTYPYDIFFRLDDIEREIERRRPDAIIHYVQSFCFRGIQDRLVRARLKLPVLTLECDRPGPLDARNRTRLEAFMEMLEA